ncbi:MAG: hypothetical protein VYD43_02200 [Actinomycetota bacterium]|nr:hypothetical protein [Actinomycetota bacterium]
MKRYILLIILFISCTSYNDAYQDETITMYKNIYTEFANLSESQMEDKLKLECNILEDEMLVHVDDGLTLNYFLEYEYYKYRFQGGSPQQVEALLFPLFYLCGLDEIIEKHWISLDYQEKNYKKISG